MVKYGVSRRLGNLLPAQTARYFLLFRARSDDILWRRGLWARPGTQSWANGRKEARLCRAGIAFTRLFHALPGSAGLRAFLARGLRPRAAGRLQHLSSVFTLEAAAAQPQGRKSACPAELFVLFDYPWFDSRRKYTKTGKSTIIWVLSPLL